jgi:hypothetical protein
MPKIPTAVINSVFYLYHSKEDHLDKQHASS